VRHAYLVAAYENRAQLETLLSLLDDERNDVYLQVDAKGSLSAEGLALHRSRLIILPPFPIHWAGFSFIKAILGLLRAATGQGYHYYHLLTGADLPLVGQDVIHRFLAGSRAEFVDFMPEYDAFAHFKAAYYHVLVETRYYRKYRWVRALGHALVKLQGLLGVDRSKRAGLPYRHGSTYFSITHDFAQYILEQEPWITATFRCSLAGDEVYLQTLAMGSPFKDRLYDPRCGMTGNLRYIDWKRRNRNSPYTFREADFAELVEAGRHAFFARKFNGQLDGAIIDLMVARLRQEEVPAPPGP
jgi:hypothetical protein